ncbi:hypothetical protein BAY61_24860 [Prauserella marina]|uniref:Uncharacterized protein n=1 Tax=Prauserella marina TaxID=530584 RepID=A0A222VUU1_9PSEU|nr:DUF3558 family protein [Prauserella marina]ASR37699.1 hypothetical protein BAY61_24860 [Prauserella marina]PWV75629.1 uncharacterized protein DUF3558 [Prauserella marina]SDD30170.1 Protein of unknown function [Prauserella marina]
MGERTKLAVAALGTAALLTMSGCGEDVAGKPVQQANGQNEPSTPSAPDEVENGFDECALVETEAIAQAIGVDTMYITSREARLQDDGSTRALCQYHPQDVPGLNGMTLSTVTGTDAERFFAPFDKHEVAEIDSIGDATKVVAFEVDGSPTAFIELRTIVGDIGLHLRYQYDQSGGGAMPEANGTALGTIVRSAIEELPGDVAIPEGQPEGVCAEIDLDLAARVLGDELVMSRTLESNAGGATCDLSNGPASLGIIHVTNEDQVAKMATKPELINEDIGDGALVEVAQTPEGQGPLHARVNVGDEIVEIFAHYADSVAQFTTPRPEDLDLVRSVVASVGGQG